MEEKGLLMMNVVLGIIINYYWLQSSLILDVTIIIDPRRNYCHGRYRILQLYYARATGREAELRISFGPRP